MLGKKKSSADKRRPAHPEEAVTDRRTGERRVVAWVGTSMFIKGDVTSSEDLTIAGDVEGRIIVRDHTLTIGPEANVRATIVAKAVTVHGAVTGTITASEVVEIGETGSVEGDIDAPRLAVADGGLLRGKIGVGAGSAGA